MSSAADRLSQIEQTYNDAADNEASDLSQAKSPVEVGAVQHNLAAARLTYFTAVAAMLTNNGADVESAYQAAMTANAGVKSARTAAEAFPTLLGKLRTATEKATHLLTKAKDVAQKLG